ncbi:MAG: polysaccharide biosynthesis/export family protein [Bacteroidia bacterium]|nr:polysaccharide biosynthesis/export family protein [Bacteroidia bacterium]
MALTVITLSSCINYKNLVFLQEQPVEEGALLDSLRPYYGEYLSDNYRIRPFDQLHIKASNYENSTINFFNSSGDGGSSSGGGSGGGGNVNATFLYLSSYIVDNRGIINLPLIGDVNVAGKTVEQVQDTLNIHLRTYLDYASTSVKLANFRITMLGEIRRPGQVYIFNTRTPILEALGMAGDVTEYANIRRVKLIREEGNSARTVYLDLADARLISSEYYFVKPNDIFYIEPVKAKAFNLNSRPISVGLSAVSVMLVIVNIVLNTLNNNN